MKSPGKDGELFLFWGCFRVQCVLGLFACELLMRPSCGSFGECSFTLERDGQGQDTGHEQNMTAARRSQLRKALLQCS